MLRVMEMPGNPSSVHAEGRALKGEIERARRNVAKLVGTEANQVVFTSGATEAANCVRSCSWNGPDGWRTFRVGHSETEHMAWHDFFQDDEEFDVVHVSREGLVAEDEFGVAPEKWGTLFAIERANGETGAIQPLERIHALAEPGRFFFVTDVVQAVGRMKIDLTALGSLAVVVSRAQDRRTTRRRCLRSAGRRLLPGTCLHRRWAGTWSARWHRERRRYRRLRRGGGSCVARLGRHAAHRSDAGPFGSGAGRPICKTWRSVARLRCRCAASAEHVVLRHRGR